MEEDLKLETETKNWPIYILSTLFYPDYSNSFFFQRTQFTFFSFHFHHSFKESSWALNLCWAPSSVRKQDMLHAEDRRKEKDAVILCWSSRWKHIHFQSTHGTAESLYRWRTGWERGVYSQPRTCMAGLYSERLQVNKKGPDLHVSS